MKRFEDPLGVGPSRQRLTEAQTEERMYAAALEIIERQGLRVSFDLLRFEDVIAAAGVARSAVYKRWPRKDQFYGEVLLRLAGDGPRSTSIHLQSALLAAVDTALNCIDWLRSPGGGRRILIEMCRVGAEENFRQLSSSQQWQIYTVLHATLATLPENEFKQAMKTSLEQSEEFFVDSASGFYELMISATGQEFIEPANARTLAVLGGSGIQGLALSAQVVPSVEQSHFEFDPFGTGDARTWTLAGLSFTSPVAALTRPDLSVVWDDAAIDQYRALFESLRDFDPGAVPPSPDDQAGDQ